jgi:hypothetical protein
MLGTYSLAELRIWWVPKRSGSCQYCGWPLTVEVAWLFQIPWTLRIPVGFFHVCA